MNKKRVWFLVGAIILLLFILFGIYFYDNQDGFSIETILVKVNLPRQGFSSWDLKISNEESFAKNFYLSSNLENLLDFEKSFSLASKVSRDINLSIYDSVGVADVYVGKISVSDEKQTKEVPVVITINDANPTFAISNSILPGKETVQSGENFGLDIKLLQFKEASDSIINAEFKIKNLDNEVVWSDEGNLLIGGQVTKMVTIPDSWDHGSYVFVTSVEYNGIKSFSSVYFEVIEEKGYFSWITKMLIVIALFVFVIVASLLIYFLKFRDKLLVQLKKQQREEIRRDIKQIKQNQVLLKKCSKKTPEKIKEIRDYKKNIVKKIKSKQNKQKSEFRKLKRGKKKTAIENKLADWKKQGYKMKEFKEEEKNLSKADLKKEFDKFKQKGYKI